MRAKTVAATRDYNFENSLFWPVGGCWVDTENVTDDRRMHPASGLQSHYMLPPLLPQQVSVSSKGKRAMSRNESRVKKERKEYQAPLTGKQS